MRKHEEWRPIPGFDGWYEVSNWGRIRSWRKKGSRLQDARADKPHIKALAMYGTRGRGRMTSNLKHQGRQIQTAVSRCVLLAFVGEAPPDKPFALHANDQPGDNRLVNLRWGSQEENYDDARKNGMAPPMRIDNCPHCKKSIGVIYSSQTKRLRLRKVTKCH